MKLKRDVNKQLKERFYAKNGKSYPGSTECLNGLFLRCFLFLDAPEPTESIDPEGTKNESDNDKGTSILKIKEDVKKKLKEGFYAKKGKCCPCTECL